MSEVLLPCDAISRAACNHTFVEIWDVWTCTPQLTKNHLPRHDLVLLCPDLRGTEESRRAQDDICQRQSTNSHVSQHKITELELLELRTTSRFGACFGPQSWHRKRVNSNTNYTRFYPQYVLWPLMQTWQFPRGLELDASTEMRRSDSSATRHT